MTASGMCLGFGCFFLTTLICRFCRNPHIPPYCCGITRCCRRGQPRSISGHWVTPLSAPRCLQPPIQGHPVVCLLFTSSSSQKTCKHRQELLRSSSSLSFWRHWYLLVFGRLSDSKSSAQVHTAKCQQGLGFVLLSKPRCLSLND